MSPVRVTDMRWGWVRKNLLLLITFSGVIVGVALGLALRAAGPDSTTILLISYPGELFIRMLKLMILPLIIASLISGSASLNARINGQIVVRTVLYFLATSLMNAILGVILVIAIHPGSSLFKLALAKEIAAAPNTASNVNILDGFLDLGRNIFPDNLFQASFQQVHTVYNEQTVSIRSNLTDGVDQQITELVRSVKYRAGTNTLGIIVFCLVFGTLLGSLGKKGAVVVDFFSVIDAVILKIVTGIMWLSPLGVASVIMSKILSVDNLGTVMSNLGLFIVTVVVGVLIWQWVFQNLLYFLFTHRNPFHFYFNLLEPWVTAFATASTKVGALLAVVRLLGDLHLLRRLFSCNGSIITVFFQLAGGETEKGDTFQLSSLYSPSPHHSSIHETLEHDLGHNARTVLTLHHCFSAVTSSGCE